MHARHEVAMIMERVGTSLFVHARLLLTHQFQTTIVLSGTLVLAQLTLDRSIGLCVCVGGGGGGTYLIHFTML